MDAVSVRLPAATDPKGGGFRGCFPTLVGDDLCSEAPKPLWRRGTAGGDRGKRRNLPRWPSQVERHTKLQGASPLTGAGSRLGYGAFGRCVSAAHRVAGGAENPLEIFRVTCGALEFYGFICIYHQQFEYIATFQTLKFIYRHGVLP